MEHLVYDFEVPGYTKFQCANGGFRRVEPKGSSEKKLSVKIYPNGDEAENEGYVSIAFDEFEFNEFASVTYISSFQCTLSVVDIEGESRFPQSFGMDFDVRNAEDVHKAIRLERFIKRSVLLDMREDLLPGDKLTLRSDGVFYYERSHDEVIERERVYSTEAEESWFIYDEESDVGDWLLDLRNPDTPLCTRLREKSEFFEALFRWPGKDLEDGYMRVPKSEYPAFMDMLGYVRFETLQHIWSNTHYWWLYGVAGKYGVLELQTECSSYLREHLPPHKAIDALKIADFYNDSGLREAAFGCILSNWNRGMYWNSGVHSELLEELGADLRNQLVCAADILKSEECSSDRSLCCLAARQVHKNRERE